MRVMNRCIMAMMITTTLSNMGACDIAGQYHMGVVVIEDFYEISFFFSSRRRHTRFDCDWSSDVCSSDLVHSGEKTSLGATSSRPSMTSRQGPGEWKQ